MAHLGWRPCRTRVTIWSCNTAVLMLSMSVRALTGAQDRLHFGYTTSTGPEGEEEMRTARR
jgi:hypothetical protein